MGVKPLKLGYYPLNLEFVDAEITADKAKLRFTYNDRIITFIQEKKKKEVSIALESDRRNRYELYNEWMQRDIEYCDNLLPDGQEEFEMLITIDNIYYYFSGMMPREEYETILKKSEFLLNNGHIFFGYSFILIKIIIKGEMAYEENEKMYFDGTVFSNVCNKISVCRGN